MNQLKDFIAQNGGLVGAVSVILVCVNILLTAVKAVLEKLQPNQPVTGVKSILVKVSGVVQGLIDWMTGNKAH